MKDKRINFILATVFLTFVNHGMFTIVTGTVLPMIKEEYQISYNLSGVLAGSINLGSIVGGLLAGFAALKLGIKRSNTIFAAIVAVSFIVTLVTHNPIVLIAGFIMAGMGKGVNASYGNMIVNAVTNNSQPALNALHMFFAVGAISCPLIVMAATAHDPHDWRTAVLVILVISVISAVCSCLMDFGSTEVVQTNEGSRSWEFLKDRRFIMLLIMMFFYQAIEGTIMGWTTTYLINTGTISESSSQALNSIMWASLLIGRIASTIISRKLKYTKIIKILSTFTLAFLILLLCAKTQSLLVIAVIGIGLGLSGQYANIFATSEDIFNKYVLAISIFFAVACIGGTAWPMLVGAVADKSGVLSGMRTVLIPAVLLAAATFVNDIKK